jgi:CRP-like cAMP-binding protein
VDIGAAAEQIARKLSSRAVLSVDDLEAIAALPAVERVLSPQEYLVREGDRPTRCGIIMTGFTYRQKITSDGARQIVLVQLPGDFVDLQNLFLQQSDHNVQALTRTVLMQIDITALRRLARSRMAIAEAMWTDTLIEASIYREWLANIGQRDAHGRMGHLLCELACRFGTPIGHMASYNFPMTQEQAADALGLTSVHVNRVLKSLERLGLISRQRRSIEIKDWKGLCSLSDFNPRYLHLDQSLAKPGDSEQTAPLFAEPGSLWSVATPTYVTTKPA